MDLPIENTYGFFQVDERCKKLERTVKMLQLKQREKKNTESCTLDTGTNISSINGDAFDTSCVYSSKLGSEIVSSSTNIKTLFAHKMNLFKNNNNIATSSVKNSPDNNSTRAIMPPPKSIPAFGNSSKENSSAACEASILNQRHDPTGLGFNCFHQTSSVISSIKCPSLLQANSPIKYATGIENSKKSVADITKPDRIFERWKVMINDKGQLIIKGVLKDCKKNVRSKPIIRRINSSVVQSCFNHIYELQGRIYDDQHELPEYIRGKFYNGFPDDWENVFQLWRNYIAGGCKSSFRWPTPVTDSDDDLKSDITELPYVKKEKKSRSHTKNQPESVSIEKSLKKLPETIIPESSKMIKGNSKSPMENIQNVANKSSKKLVSLSEDTSDASVPVNSFLEKMHDQYFNNSTTTNHTIDEDISNAVSKILNNKNCSIEYIDKIIEMFNCYKYVITPKPQNLPVNINKNNSSASVTERVPSVERTSINSNVTYTKVENIQNHTPKGLSPHPVQNHSYDFGDVSKSSSRSNVSSVRKVCRKLYKKHYDSSELSDNDTEVERRKFPKQVSKIYRNQKITEAMSNKKQPLRKVNDDSDDDFVPKKDTYPSVRNVYADKPVNNICTQANEVDSEGFMKPIPKIQSKDTLNNPINTNSPSSKYHRQRKASSPSTITGFLANYDSCVSISEDDRRVRTPRPRLNDKRTVDDINGKTLSSFKSKLNQASSNSYYDSSVSLTEDEIKEVGHKINGLDIRKQVLQEPNIQCFQQMLKRNLKHNTKNEGFFDKKHLQDHARVKEQCSLSQNKEPKDFAFSKHISTNLNDDKENTSDRIEKETQSNQHLSDNYQTNVSKLHKEKMKPSITNIEEVSYNVDDLLVKKVYPEEVIKKDSSKNKKIENCSKENNSLPMPSTSNNVSYAKNSKSLELDSIIACKDVSVQLEDIKNMLKPKPNAEKNTNDTKSSEKVIFGSEENPKQLRSWFPNVIKKADSIYGLVFEGKLLNEAGHVINKKFRTDFIVKKVSLKIVKTDKNEFYQLIGDLTDSKHVIPKELHKHCLNGCPGQITKFCEKWRSIIDNSNKLDETVNSIGMKNAHQSSRGRCILPSLSYWSGERLSIKGNNTIYTPPTSFCSSFEISKKDPSLSVKKNLSNSEKQDKEKNFSKEKENIIDEQVIEDDRELKETTRFRKKKDVIKLRRSFRKRKELIKINNSKKDSSDSSSEEEHPVSKRQKKGYDDTRKKGNSQESLNKNDNEKRSNFDKNDEKKLKRGRSIGDKQNNISPIKSNEITVKYYKTTSRKNDLSEYESSFLD